METHNVRKIIMLLFMFGLLIGTASAEIEIVNVTHVLYTSSSTVSVSTGVNQSNGILVYASGMWGSITSVTDSLGNNYSLLAPVVMNENPYQGAGWYYALCNSSGVNTITVNFGANPNAFQVIELSGVNNSDPSDYTNEANSATVPYVGHAGDLMLIGWYAAGASNSLTNNFSFISSNQLTTGGGGNQNPIAYKSIENYESSTCTLGGTSYCGWAIALQPAEESQPNPVTSNFSANTTYGHIPLSVQFTDLSENSNAWSWDFGDGNTSTDQNPTHTYSSVGLFNVSLNASNTSSGSFGVETKSNYIESTPVLIQFHTIGQTFQPIVNVTGDTTVLWRYSDGTNSTLPSPPLKDFGSTGNRIQTFWASNWSGVQLINIGYNAPDGGDPNLTQTMAEQGVSEIEGLDLVSSGLENITATHTLGGNYNTFSDISFENFTHLRNAELFGSELTTINLKNCTALERVCVAGSKLTSLDISECPEMGDIRADGQRITENFSITYGNNLDNVWHLCIMNNHLIEPVPWSQLPNIREIYIMGCSLNKSEVDRALLEVDALNTSWPLQNPFLSMTSNAHPSYSSTAHIANLTSPTRGWSVYIESIDSPVVPTVDFSSNVSSGTYPLSVLFTDTSINATSWQWSFGDGSANSTLQNPTHLFAAGNYSVTLTATNLDGSNSTSRDVTVSKASTSITWSNPANITYGTQLSETQLNGAGSVSGTLTYNPVSGTVLGTGTNTLNVTLVPTDSANYSNSTGSVTLIVTKADTSVTWPSPANITYPTTLSSTQLNASGSVAGTMVYSPVNNTTLSGGTHTLNVAFTPTDTANYSNSTGSTTINVSKAPTSVTWSSPNMVYGTALSGTQLNAVGSVPGSRVYNPVIGTILAAGNQTLNCAFTPTDTTNYSNSTGSVTITVIKALPTITWNTPASIVNGTALSGTQLNAQSPVTGTFDYVPPSGTVLSVGTHTLNTSFIPTDPTNYTNSSASVYLNVTATTSPPISNFSANVTSGNVPFTVQFTDLSTGSPTSWTWSFGDTETNTSQNPTHTYTDEGEYDVSLNATNANGSNTDTKIGYITASPTPNPPVAAFSANVTSGHIPLSVQFTDLSTWTPTSWLWSFGDGNTSTLQNPTNVYNEIGTYTVTLNATNANGLDIESKIGYIIASEPSDLSDYTDSLFSLRSRLYKLGQGDSRTFNDTIYYNSSVVDLSGVHVEFSMSNQIQTIKTNITCTGYTNGVVSIPVNRSTSAIAGKYFGQFILTDEDVRITVPEEGHVEMRINEAV